MRKSGKTTRSVDTAIQILFEYGKVSVPRKSKSDSVGYNKALCVWDEGLNQEISIEIIQKELYNRILLRMSTEHRDQFKISLDGMTIELIS